MAAVESTIVASAMPTIVAALGGFELFSWVFTAYLLGQACTIPIYGRLADLYGRKWILTSGAILFLVGTSLCSLAQGMVSLILFRALQGAGAGALVPVAITIVGDIYPPAERAKVQGYLNILWGVAAVMGPLLGAFLVAHLGWPAIFWVNLPIGFVTLAILILAFREVPQPKQRRIDYAGSVLLVAGIGSLMVALVQWAHLPGATTAGLLVVATVSLTALVYHEMHMSEPMLAPELWRNRIVAATNIGALAIGATMMAVNVFVPIYVQGLLGGTPLLAGFTLTSQSIAWTFSGALAGWGAAYRSYRQVAVWGGLSLVLGALFLVALTPERGALWAAAGASFTGFGMGFSNTTFIIAAQSSVAWDQRGMATSGNIFMRMVGQSLGTAVLGGVLNASLAGRIPGADVAIDRLMSPALRRAMPAVELDSLTTAMEAALGNVFLVTLSCALLALAVAFLLPAGHGTKS